MVHLVDEIEWSRQVGESSKKGAGVMRPLYCQPSDSSPVTSFDANFPDPGDNLRRPGIGFGQSEPPKVLIRSSFRPSLLLFQHPVVPRHKRNN